MANYEVRLLRQERVAEDTMAFYFSKPDGYTYRAGQSARLTVIDPPENDRKGNSRTFNLASAPHDSELMIATRLRGSLFKRTLQQAPVGTICRIGDPGGALVLHKDSSRPAVFLAGGIGITPFLSILRHAAHAALPHRIYLFYSNRRPSLAAFLPELQALQRSNTNCQLIATITTADGSTQSWPGERGRIGRELLERRLPDLMAPIYYLAGPPVMTTAMLDVLQDNGVRDDAIKSAEFYGY
jgi:ferredoxin-NADP reductase